MEVDQSFCRTIFAGSANDERLADLIECSAPQGACEQFSVGQGSPGPIGSGEVLLRIVTSPRDFDPVKGEFTEAPFKKVYSNGLSVLRSIATDQDATELTEDGMWRQADKPEKQVWGVLSASVDAVRSISAADCSRAFGVYDQTVPRPDPEKQPIPTHAGVFLRVPAPKEPNRKMVQRDFAGKLKELFESGQISLDAFRNGLLGAVNERALKGDFIIKDGN